MAKDKFVAVSGLKLTPNSLKKMAKHQGTLLKHDHLTGGEMEIFVTPMKAKRMINAVKKGKGMKLTMTPDEMEHTMKHGKGVSLPSRKIFTPPKEGSVVLSKKGVIAHPAPVASVNAGNDTFQVVRGDPVAPSAPKKRGRKPKAKADADEGGKVDFKAIGRKIRKTAQSVADGYKKNVRDTPVGSAVRAGVKTAIVSGATALPAMLGQPQLAPLAGMIAKPLADLAVEKAGLGSGFRLNSNYNNFLNSQHPAMHPTLRQPDNSIPRKVGGSFVSSGSYQSGRLRAGRGTDVVNNIQPHGSALNPMLPPADNSLNRGSGMRSAGY